MSNPSQKHYDKELKEIAFDMGILLVEDDAILQSQMKIFLSKFFGYVESANNGEEALKKYEQKKYDLVVTDLTMPKMDGLELVKHIKQIAEDQKIIVISAHSESQRLIELINLGVDGFLLKPINVPQMIQRLHTLAHAIYDQKMLKYFSKMLEETNQELKQSNIALENALHEISYCKVHKTHHTRETYISHEQSKKAASDFYTKYALQLEELNENLENLEYSFNLLILNSDTDVSQYFISQLLNILADYALSIKPLEEFVEIYEALIELQEFLSTNDVFTNKTSSISLITTLFDELEYWRKSLFEYRNLNDISKMHTTIVQTIATLTQKE